MYLLVACQRKIQQAWQSCLPAPNILSTNKFQQRSMKHIDVLYVASLNGDTAQDAHSSDEDEGFLLNDDYFPVDAQIIAGWKKQNTDRSKELLARLRKKYHPSWLVRLSRRRQENASPWKGARVKYVTENDQLEAMVVEDKTQEEVVEETSDEEDEQMESEPSEIIVPELPKQIIEQEPDMEEYAGEKDDFFVAEDDKEETSTTMFKSMPLNEDFLSLFNDTIEAQPAFQKKKAFVPPRTSNSIVSNTMVRNFANNNKSAPPPIEARTFASPHGIEKPRPVQPVRTNYWSVMKEQYTKSSNKQQRKRGTGNWQGNKIKF